MARFVHRHRVLLLGDQDVGALAPSENDAVASLVEIGRGNDVAILPHRHNGRLIDQIGQVRSGETRSAPRHHLEIDALVELLTLGMDLEDGHPLGQDREGDGDLPIEAPGTKQGRIEDLRTVGGRENDDPGGRIEAVHLGQQLIQRLLALVVGDHGAGARSALPDGIDLVDEDDRRGALARLGEEIAYPGRPDADEQLHEARSAHREERDLGLARHGTGQERLAGARRPHHQDAPGRHGARLGIALGLLEEVDHLADLHLGALITGHIGKGRGRPLQVEDLGL